MENSGTNSEDYEPFSAEFQGLPTRLKTE
jgi:hypothetical protein